MGVIKNVTVSRGQISNCKLFRLWEVSDTGPPKFCPRGALMDTGSTNTAPSSVRARAYRSWAQQALFWATTSLLLLGGRLTAVYRHSIRNTICLELNRVSLIDATNDRTVCKKFDVELKAKTFLMSKTHSEIRANRSEKS